MIAIIIISLIVLVILAAIVGKGIKKTPEPKEPVKDEFNWYKDIWP